MQSQIKNEFFPVYALIGSDKLKIKFVLDRLEKKLESFGNINFNTSIFDGNTDQCDLVVQACMQAPFAGEKRYVLLKNANKIKKDDIDALVKYLENPTKTTILVLVCEKLPKSSRIYKACNKISATTIINCSPPKKYKLAESLNSIAKKYNGSININAAHKLVEYIGEDTMRLDSEIQKMLLSSSSNTITIEQVESQVVKTTEIKPWDFTNLFASRNIKECIDSYKLMPKGSEFILLSQTCKIVKELICVYDLKDQASPSNIAKCLGYEVWRVKNHYKWAHNFTKKQLINILIKAYNCEKKMKSTSNSALAFETFILESLKN